MIVGQYISEYEQHQAKAVEAIVERQIQSTVMPQLQQFLDTLNQKLASTNGHQVAQKVPAASQNDAQVGQTLLTLLLQRLAPPAQQAGMDAFAGPFNQMAAIMNTVRSIFLEPQMETFRSGMKASADAYSFAVRATGQVPDAATFNQLLDQAPLPSTGAEHQAQLRDTLQDEARRLAGV